MDIARPTFYRMHGTDHPQCPKGYELIGFAEDPEAKWYRQRDKIVIDVGKETNIEGFHFAVLAPRRPGMEYIREVDNVGHEDLRPRRRMDFDAEQFWTRRGSTLSYLVQKIRSEIFSGIGFEGRIPPRTQIAVRYPLPFVWRRL